jgi:hypothetical protein
VPHPPHLDEPLKQEAKINPSSSCFPGVFGHSNKKVKDTVINCRAELISYFTHSKRETLKSEGTAQVTRLAGGELILGYWFA